jgi:hypothetical protein
VNDFLLLSQFPGHSSALLSLRLTFPSVLLYLLLELLAQGFFLFGPERALFLEFLA